MSINICTFSGRLTAKPVTRNGKNDTTYTTGSLAIDQSYTPKGGTKVDKVLFVNFIASNGLGKVISQYKDKGDFLVLSGELQANNYETKEGVKINGVQLRVQECDFGPKVNKPTEDQENLPGTN